MKLKCVRCIDEQTVTEGELVDIISANAILANYNISDPAICRSMQKSALSKIVTEIGADKCFWELDARETSWSLPACRSEPDV